MSRSVWILLILLVLWILIGLYLYPKFMHRANSTDSQPCVVSWELKDDSLKPQVIAKSDATINFEKSTSEIYNLDGELKKSIEQIAKYLKRNNNAIITVVGYYDDGETPATGTLRDLAVNRANAVKAMLTIDGASPNQLAIIPKMYEDNDNSDCLIDNTLNRGASFFFGREEGSE